MKPQRLLMVSFIFVLLTGCNMSSPVRKTQPNIIPSIEPQDVVEIDNLGQDEFGLENSENYRIIDQREGETIMKGQTRYEVVAVTSEIERDELMVIARDIKDVFKDKYNQYGDIQIYIFDEEYSKEVSNYLSVSYEASIEQAEYYNKMARMTLYMKQDKYSLLYLHDENGKIVETIENFSGL